MNEIDEILEYATPESEYGDITTLANEVRRLRKVEELAVNVAYDWAKNPNGRVRARFAKPLIAAISDSVDHLEKRALWLKDGGP